MEITKFAEETVLSNLKLRFSDWQGISTPRFIEEEIKYKEKHSKNARTILKEETLRKLIDEQKYDEFIKLFERVGRSTNLLFLSVPTRGDLSSLYSENMDPASFSSALLDLIYGEGSSPQRLSRYLDYVTENELPNKWTFPTFYLFLTDPEHSIFIKPRVTKNFLKRLGYDHLWKSKPDIDTYTSILELMDGLRDTISDDKNDKITMIHLHSVLWSVGGIEKLTAPKVEQTKIDLSPPLASIFCSEVEADNAFYWLSESFDTLGIKKADDPMIAFTLTQKGKTNRLRFDYGNYLILGFSGVNGTLKEIDLILHSSVIDAEIPYKNKSEFSYSGEEPEFYLVTIASDVFNEKQDDLSEMYSITLEEVFKHFASWGASPFRPHHRMSLAKAVLDEKYREKIFKNGLPSITATNKSAISRQCFELLDTLEKHPTIEKYKEIKKDVERFVIIPFKHIVQAVVDFLPKDIHAQIETKKNIFSRFPKNDFGKGGVHSHYWSAFYPVGKSRTTGAQLFFWDSRFVS
jgi:hypothetical protein